MSPGYKKFVVLATLAIVVLLANAHTIACWFDRQGVIAWAQQVRSEYITGTAITVILAMFYLLDGKEAIRRCSDFLQRCPVCDHSVSRSGRYCAACGSRVA